eukprot:970633-Pyramimonas_sp.AAC.1
MEFSLVFGALSDFCIWCSHLGGPHLPVAQHQGTTRRVPTLEFRAYPAAAGGALARGAVAESGISLLEGRAEAGGAVRGVVIPVLEGARRWLHQVVHQRAPPVGRSGK